jgi:hypothetical protein
MTARQDGVAISAENSRLIRRCQPGLQTSNNPMKSLDHSLEPDSSLPSPAPLQMTQTATTATATQHTASALLVMQSRALSHGDFKAAAVSAVSDLALLLQCERASLGLCLQGQIRIQAISGLRDLRAEQAAVQALAQTMEESVDQRCALVFPALETDTATHASASSTLLHANLS